MTEADETQLDDSAVRDDGQTTFVVTKDGDVLVSKSVERGASYVEAIDVDDGEYESSFTVEGYPLAPRIDDDDSVRLIATGARDLAGRGASPTDRRLRTDSAAKGERGGCANHQEPDPVTSRRGHRRHAGEPVRVTQSAVAGSTAELPEHPQPREPAVGVNVEPHVVDHGVRGGWPDREQVPGVGLQLGVRQQLDGVLERRRVGGVRCA